MIEASLLSIIGACLLAGQFVRIELFNRMVNGYGQEFFILLFILYSIRKYGLKPVWKLLQKWDVRAIFVVFVVSFLLTIKDYTLAQNSIAFLFPLRIILYVLFGVYLADVIKRQKNIRIFLDSLLFTFSILLLIATAIQYIFFTNLWSMHSAGWDPHEFRAYVTFLDVFVAGAIFGMFAFYWAKKRNWVLAVLFVVCVVLSFSRSAYVSFLFATCISLFPRKKWKEFVTILAFFITLILFVPKPFGEGVNLLRTVSINSRVLDYREALSIWQKQPLFGHGYNRIRFVKENRDLIKIDDQSHAASSFHSSYLIILATMGVVGLTVFLFCLFQLVKQFPESSSILFFIFCMSLFDNVILHVLVLLPLVLLIVSLKKQH